MKRTTNTNNQRIASADMSPRTLREIRQAKPRAPRDRTSDSPSPHRIKATIQNHELAQAIEQAKKYLPPPTDPNPGYQATQKWLREQGATRPMAPAGVIMLVLGEWTPTEGTSTGSYPVTYIKRLSAGRHGSEAVWYHHHKELKAPPTRGECLQWITQAKNR